MPLATAVMWVPGRYLSSNTTKLISGRYSSPSGRETVVSARRRNGCDPISCMSTSSTRMISSNPPRINVDPSSPTMPRLHLLLGLLALCCRCRRSLSSSPASPPCASAIFAFGDSTIDPGNNDFLPTVIKSNFPPYGRDFSGHRPTGRFSNGRLVTDFVASYLGLKDHLPPYLGLPLGLRELMTGVSFASAGSGFDPLTNHLAGVMPVLSQTGLFKTYKARMELLIGEDPTADLIRRALFVVSAGTLDFIFNYFALPSTRKHYTIDEYQAFLLQKIRDLLQELQGLGAKMILVAGLPPMGCLPMVITLNWHGGFQERRCVERFNSLARDFNARLRAQLHETSYSSGATIVYADIYAPLKDVIEAPAKYGFQETTSGCCATGLIEASFLCNAKSPVCPDASEYVFWDSVHPTEKTYRIVFDALRPSIVNRFGCSDGNIVP